MKNIVKLLVVAIVLPVACICQSNEHLVSNNQSHTKMNKIVASKSNGFLTVGPGANCNYNNIQGAINELVNTTFDEIRVTNNHVYFENITIYQSLFHSIGKNLHIRGGFANCIEAENNNQTPIITTIDGSGLGSVIQIYGNAALQSPTNPHLLIPEITTFTLDHLKITHGLADSSISDFGGGGILIVHNIGHIIINQSNIYINQAASGGGIYIEGSNNVTTSKVTIKDSVIQNNNAQVSGGGLVCANITSLDIINSEILNNQAITGIGGGIVISEGCITNIYSPTKINANLANLDGGGIAILNGESVTFNGQKNCVNNNCLGSNEFPIEINGNSAGFPNITHNGGGLYIVNSLVHAFGVNISNNKALNGGAIYLENNADFLLDRVYKECWDSVRCNLIANNKTKKLNGVGGAIYNKNSTLHLESTVFEDNRADTATAIYTTGSTAATQIISSLFTRNGSAVNHDWNDLYLMRVYNNGTLNIYDTTIAHNNTQNSVLSTSTANLNVFSSIIADGNSGNILSQQGTNKTFIYCLLAHEKNSFNGGEILVADPKFVDATNRDYHIKISSPAIDFCNVSIGVSDIDFEPRGIDDFRVMENFPASYWDIGMDEYIDDLTFLIFKNSFE